MTLPIHASRPWPLTRQPTGGQCARVKTDGLDSRHDAPSRVPRTQPAQDPRRSVEGARLAELALTLVRTQTGQCMDHLVQKLSLRLAAATVSPDPAADTD
jgi:hypothetical protein